jgi:RNA polymerase sigma-70 factor (ECF subfamily)
LKPERPEVPSNPASAGPGRAGPRQEDAACVERARQGDEQAFRELVERHRDRAYGLALRILRSVPEAEDAAQEAFVSAWQALPNFRGESGFSTWLYRIVAHRSFDRLEQLKRRRTHEATIGSAGEPAAEAHDSESQARARRLERLMAALSPVQRAAVTLYYWQDHSVEGTAAALGIPENTVKTHLSRARAQLREAWMKGEHDEPRV